MKKYQVIVSLDVPEVIAQAGAEEVALYVREAMAAGFELLAAERATPTAVVTNLNAVEMRRPV